MELKVAQALAIELMKKHNLFQTGWKFQFNNRRGSFGVCSYTRKTIYLSGLMTPLVRDEEVLDTILHEIAHALTPGHHHDHVWLAKYREIGGKGFRTASLMDKAIDKEAAQKAVINHTKYYLECPKCSSKRPIARKPKRRKACGICVPGRFSHDHIMVLKLSKAA